MSPTRRRRSASPRAAQRAGAPVVALPPVRLTRVRTALRRIASGYYDRDDVRDRLVAAVLKEIDKA